jgi:hypothetical protein
MKKTSLVLAMVLGLFVLVTGVSTACTLGVKECRPGTPQGTCYWWWCETCGSETCWIFKGTTCTCPQAKNENDLYDDHDQNLIIQCSEDSGSDWLPQNNGSYRRTCVVFSIAGYINPFNRFFPTISPLSSAPAKLNL